MNNQYIFNIISIIILLYLLFKQSNEKMSNIDIATENKIREIYKIDTDAIRNLSNLAKNLTLDGSLTVPGGLNIQGNLTSNGIYRISKEGHNIGSNNYSMEIFAPNHNDVKETSIRFHQGNKYWNQIRCDNRGFRLTSGENENLSNLEANNITANRILEKGNLLVPVGTIIFVAMNTAPAGYLPALGQSVSKLEYNDLFNAIKYTFGGSGNNFNLPNLKGEFIRGWNNTNTGKDANRAFGSKQDFAIQKITGNINGLIHGCNIGASANGVFNRSFGGENNNCGRYGGQNNNFNFDSSRVVNSANETRPTNIALLPCIKF
jgi:microcystin-dependent protein